MFVSYGSLTREGGYQIRVFRSKSADGPYTDALEQEMGGVTDHYQYGVKLMGNYILPSNEKAYMAPGHCSAFTDKDGKMYVVYHTRFDSGSEYHEPRVHQLFVTKSGWLAAAPFATNGEELSQEGYQDKDVEGTWYLLNHGLSIDGNINTTKEIMLGADSDIKYEVEKDTNHITLMIDGVSYEGVIIDMKDEAGNETRCITAVGSNNQTIWAVHYK